MPIPAPIVPVTSREEASLPATAPATAFLLWAGLLLFAGPAAAEAVSGHPLASPAEPVPTGTTAPRSQEEPQVPEVEAAPEDELEPAPPALLREAALRRAPILDLLAIYRRMDGLQDIRVHMEGGILEVSGTALTPEAKAEALEMARQVPGVTWVDDRLEVEADFRKRLAPAWERMEEKAIAFLRFFPSLLVGLFIAAGAFVLAYWVGNRSFPFDRLVPNAFAGNLLRQGVRAAIVLAGLLVALDLMAATALVGAVLGAAGLLGIAVGFAFRDIVENYLAGVLLSLRQPFAPNDHLELAGHEGRVVRLTGRETVLMTLDGNHVRIPNATVYKSVTTNFTRNPRRRFLITLSVAPWEELGRVLALARGTLSELPGVLEDPRVSVRVHALGDSSVEIRVSGWVDQTQADFGKVRSQALRALKEALEDAGVATPPPEYGIRILEGAVEAHSALREPGEGEPQEPGKPGPPAPPEEEPDDVSPDTTIEDEIARELADSEEENLLRPSSPESPSTSEGPDRPPAST